MAHWKVILIALAATSALAAEPEITCEPRELRGVPGEPLQLELTVETDRPSLFHLRIPSVSNLVLRTIEKAPIRRKKNGRYVQKRTILWQGLEAGSTTITNLTAVFKTLKQTTENIPTIEKEKPSATQLVAASLPSLRASPTSCPDIRIVIDAVEPAEPPALTEAME